MALPHLLMIMLLSTVATLNVTLMLNKAKKNYYLIIAYHGLGFRWVFYQQDERKIIVLWPVWRDFFLIKSIFNLSLNILPEMILFVMMVASVVIYQNVSAVWDIVFDNILRVHIVIALEVFRFVEHRIVHMHLQ